VDRRELFSQYLGGLAILLRQMARNPPNFHGFSLCAIGERGVSYSSAADQYAPLVSCSHFACPLLLNNAP